MHQEAYRTRHRKLEIALKKSIAKSTDGQSRPQNTNTHSDIHVFFSREHAIKFNDLVYLCLLTGLSIRRNIGYEQTMPHSWHQALNVVCIP